MLNIEWMIIMKLLLILLLFFEMLKIVFLSMWLFEVFICFFFYKRGVLVVYYDKYYWIC